MPPKASYLVRGPNGRMSTVIAQSTRGAMRAWRDLNRAALIKWQKANPGQAGFVSVKLRGGKADWDDFKIKG